MTVNSATLLADYWQGAHLTDPPAYLDRVRAMSPVLYEPGAGFALLTGHPEVAAALKSPLVRTGKYDGGPGFQETATYALMSPMMLFHDGMDHTRLRSLAQRAFTPRVLEESRAFIAALTDDLLNRAAARAAENGGEVDVVEALAVPLPVTVIIQMLGLRGEDAERFRTWAGSVADLLGGLNMTPERWAELEADAAAMRAYFRDLADELRAGPQPGLLSALAGVEDGGGRLSGDELLANAVLLLVAGHETTSNLISGSVQALQTFREERDWLGEDLPGRMGNAVEELLRFTSPVLSTGRFTTGPLTLGGVTLPTGVHLSISLGGANRDPRVFADPHTLHLGRENAKAHLGFAAGAHYCLGATLARMEADTFLTRFLTRFPGYTVPEQPLTYHPNFTLRGLQGLRVRL
ncbi:cytochrome P450 [Deinococcus hopiensis]|uniref:Cytochrome P450 n=1 Tax=Deinococcus hopiensis KR-140 TaxID=695939 RepID=A0A1W1V5W8_9DEIO|nr:cytochrome P450 [Deinococcus hopiensis]SMB88772.1 Cytochrome P450 [Deinococcus hopiensis KR-140]